jgi:hypothetical protein
MPKSKQKMHLSFSDEGFERFVALKHRSGSASFSELVRRAMAVYEFVVDAYDKGYEIRRCKEGEADVVVELCR